MNAADKRKEFLIRIVPPVAAVAAVVAFGFLGLWQLDRAAQKEALVEMFADDAPYRNVDGMTDLVPFENIQMRGRPLSDRQILIENIVRNSRLGRFVITPLDVGDGEPLLLVNRGWVEMPLGDAAGDLELDDEWRLVRGRAGRLPRVGIRSGDAFANPDGWPRSGVYPTNAEVAGQLGREVLPFVLLLDRGENDGFLRNWEPAQAGPMTHYGYAFQWFAMAFTVIVIAVWHLRKRRVPQ